MQEIELSNEQWALIVPHLPKYKASLQGGRPRLDLKKVFEGILFIKGNKLPWAAMPKSYGSKTAINDYYRHWKERGVFNSLKESLPRHQELFGCLGL